MCMAIPQMRHTFTSSMLAVLVTGKHTYVYKNGAIYWLHKVCLIVCTLELMLSGHGDDVLL